MTKPNLAGFGLFAKIFTIPAGNDNIISPDILTWHFDSSLPLKKGNNKISRNFREIKQSEKN